MTIGEFAEAVRTYSMALGASATSWGRTAAHNRAVMGVEFSAHRFWLGCDVIYDGAPSVQERNTIAVRLGLKVIIEGDHDHLQPLGWPAG